MELDLLEGRPEEISKLLINLKNWDKVDCIYYLKQFIYENNLKIKDILSKDQIDTVFENMNENEIKSKWLIPLFQNAKSVQQLFNPANFN